MIPGCEGPGMDWRVSWLFLVFSVCCVVLAEQEEARPGLWSMGAASFLPSHCAGHSPGLRSTLVETREAAVPQRPGLTSFPALGVICMVPEVTERV